MALVVSTGGGGRISNVGVAAPGRITGVGVAQPGVISGVVNATPGRITSVGNANQFGAPAVSPAAVPRPVGPSYGGAPAQVYAPPIDLNAIRAGARTAAESAVNPLYQRQLSDLLAREAVKRARGQEDYKKNLEDLDASLKELQEGNALTGARTTEDVATNTAALNTAEDITQQDQGTQFANDRIAEARRLAASGLTTSGQGRQQVASTSETRNLTEKRQGEEFQGKRNAQAVLKARTFEDLAKSNLIGQTKTEKGKVAAKLNLDRLLQDIDYEQNQGQQSLEKQRYQDVAAEQARQAKIAVQNFIAGIRDPAQRQAAYAAYGGAF